MIKLIKLYIKSYIKLIPPGKTIFKKHSLIRVKKHHISFYQPDCITKLKYDSFRAVSKYSLFTRHLNYYKKNFYIFFFFFTKYKVSEKNIIFNDKNINKSNFYKNKKLSKIDEIDVDKTLVSKKNVMVQKSSLNISLNIMIMVSLDHCV